MLYLFGKGGIDFLRDILDLPGRDSCIEISPADIGKEIQFIDFRKDGGCSLSSNLAAVRPVNFVAVIAGRIVGCRDHDAGAASENTHRITEARCGHQSWIEPDTDSVCCKDRSRCFTEDVALQAAVVGKRDRRRRKLLQEIVCKALRCLRHSIDIHAVGARPEDAAEAAGAKGEVTVESILDLCGCHGGKLRFDFRIVGK